MKRVYLDHNATTPMRPAVRERFQERLDALGGNPSSVHRSGRAARATLDEAREQVAAALRVDEDEILFTGGGTESIQIAVLGAVRAAGPTAGLLTTAIEHSAVLGAAETLSDEGHPVRRLGVDSAGRIDLDRLVFELSSLSPRLVSIQAANNEIGVLQPLEDIARRISDLGPTPPRLHTDAVQALGRMPLDLAHLGVDLASFSAHKLGGPLGVGILFRRKGTNLRPPFVGGGQEGGLRPGTENVPAIAAAALAVELAVRETVEAAARWRSCCTSFWRQLQAVIPGVVLNGPPLDDTSRLPNTLNLAFPPPLGGGLDGRVLVARLDLEGLEVSSGSACASGSLEPSHVLLALGHAPERARAALRVSFGWPTSEEDVHTAVEILRRTFLSSR